MNLQARIFSIYLSKKVYVWNTRNRMCDWSSFDTSMAASIAACVANRLQNAISPAVKMRLVTAH